MPDVGCSRCGRTAVVVNRGFLREPVGYFCERHRTWAVLHAEQTGQTTAWLACSRCHGEGYADGARCRLCNASVTPSRWPD